jgi:hypothetical protein
MLPMDNVRVGLCRETATSELTVAMWLANYGMRDLRSVPAPTTRPRTLCRNVLLNRRPIKEQGGYFQYVMVGR